MKARRRLHTVGSNWYPCGMDELERAVEKVVGQCLGVTAGEEVVVVADTTRRRTGNVLREAAARAGADAVVMVMDPRETDGREPPPPVAAALLNSDVYATSLAGVGLAAERPARLTVTNGELVDVDGREGEALLRTLSGAGPNGVNLAELGVGTNESAGLLGNVLEDEKILGTLHVAFGASAGYGGTVRVSVHLDCVVLSPTLDVGGTRVLEAGEFVLDS